MPEKPEQENNCGSEGIFSPVAGILGSLQANEVLKTILNLKDDLNNNILLFNALKSSLRKIKINSNPSCHNKCQK
jgi:adenylyltransferase/sulfurtransferase